MKAEIISDGRTVWVNAPDGMCIGRFRNDIMDVHHDAEGQGRGLHCLDCATGADVSWDRFVSSMKKHHDVDVPNRLRPAARNAR